MLGAEKARAPKSLKQNYCEVGQRVVYCSDYGLAGVVKFAGSTEFSDGNDWVGTLPAR